MKIIFLDIDGVLNHKGGNTVTPDDLYFIEDEQMKILVRMVDATGAYLVLSSSWRFGWREADQGDVYSIFAQNFFRLRDKFHEYGLGFLSKTPILVDFGREKEILYWLSSWEEEKIEAYAIIDDEEYNFPTQKKHLIQTKSSEGLQEYHIEQVINLLGKNNKIEYKELKAMLNFDKIKKLGVNPDKGLHFFGGDEKMYSKYLVDFANEKFVEEAILSLRNGDVNEAFMSFHKFKALAEYICIPNIDAVVYEVTETLRAGKTEGVMDGLMFVKTAVADIKKEISNQVAKQ